MHLTLKKGRRVGWGGVPGSSAAGGGEAVKPGYTYGYANNPEGELNKLFR